MSTFRLPANRAEAFALLKRHAPAEADQFAEIPAGQRLALLAKVAEAEVSVQLGKESGIGEGAGVRSSQIAALIGTMDDQLTGSGNRWPGGFEAFSRLVGVRQPFRLSLDTLDRLWRTLGATG